MVSIFWVASRSRPEDSYAFPHWDVEAFEVSSSILGPEGKEIQLLDAYCSLWKVEQKLLI